MRADPNDRIISADGPPVSPVSVPRIFAVGLALPFAHPLRLILCSVLPLALIVVLGLAPMERIIVMWQTIFSAARSGGMGAATTAPPVLPADVGADVLKVEGVLFLALSLWLCAWQRAAARGFGEPILRWLGSSLLRLPGYVLALAVWLLAPVVVLLIPIGVTLGLIALNMGLGWAAPSRQVAGEMAAIPGMLSDLQWWVLAIAMLTVALVALWLNARLSPLPALVASQGWRRALGRAWRLSHGHGFGLSVSLLGYTLLAFLAILIAGIAFGALMVAGAGGGIPDTGTAVTFGGIVDLGGTALIAIWHASLGALVVRDGLSPAEALDLAMFD